jgi:5'-nucleotidase
MARHPLKHPFAWPVIALVILGPPEGGHDVRNARHGRSVFGQFSRTLQAQQEEPGSPRTQAPLTLLQINDVYSTVPIDGVGGLARVATLKQQLAKAGRTPFLVLAGDFLSPSVASTVFKGEQMVAALNAAGVDLVTLGNHEFDFGDDVLIQRMRESTFEWVVSNVVDTNTGKPIGKAVPYIVKSFGTLKVGFIGLCLTSREIAPEKMKHTRLVDPLVSAAEYIPALKREGATVIVAVTHLSFADDVGLIDRFPEIDLIIGGHEHYPIASTENRTLVSKAGSDARWVARIDVNRRADRAVERFYELVPITSGLADDSRTAATVAEYESRLSIELEAVVGTTRVPLDAVTSRLRAGETNLGDLIADAVRADAGTEIAIVNSGSIRGDRLYPIGPLTKRTLLAMLPFGNVTATLSVPGSGVLQALNHAVARLPASAGQFPQVSGLTMKVNVNAPPGDRVSDVRVNGRPLNAARHYSVAIPDFLFEGGDSFTMFAGQRVIVGPESGNLLVSALEKHVADKREVAPEIDGRITILR